MTDIPASQTVARTKFLPVLLLIAATAACLLPFIGKAINIDDPLFVWSAQQIQAHPLDPYGFMVNWYDTEMPMSAVTENPPLASYFMALMAFMFGWSEIGLHLAFLIPAAAVIAGTYYLARKLCPLPLVAALAALSTPVFLISANTVMCDILMLALWVWAVVLWVHGLDTRQHKALLWSAVLITLCTLTKYYGLTLIPLLFTYTLIKNRRVGSWAIYLLIPLLVFGGYQLWMHALYGRWMLAKAASYATGFRSDNSASLLPKTLVALAFTGGSLDAVAFYSHLVWSRRSLFAGLIAVAAAVFALPMAKRIGDWPLHGTQGTEWAVVVQVALFAMVGISALALGFMDAWKRRDPESVMLMLWLWGTFAFTAFFNWSVNGRSVLPMVPAAAILLMRRVAERDKTAAQEISPRLILPLVPALLIALFTARADCLFANTARTAVMRLREETAGQSGAVWFRGHWGYQYYMMKTATGQPVDVRSFAPSLGDIVVMPDNAPTSLPMPPGTLRLQKVISIPACPWLATMDRAAGAGFYSDGWGPLPFAFGPVPPERYRIYAVDSNSAEAHYNQGVTFFNQGSSEEAAREFREALRIEPGYARAHAALGELLAAQGDSGAAIDHLNKALKLDTRDEKTHNNLGKLLASRGRTREAISHFKEAIKINPQYAPAHQNMAIALYYEKRYAEAWDEVNQCSKLGALPDPDFITALSRKMPEPTH